MSGKLDIDSRVVLILNTTSELSERFECSLVVSNLLLLSFVTIADSFASRSVDR
jgi:hypothetical protein